MLHLKMYLECIFIRHHVFHGVTYRCRSGHCEVKIFILTAASKEELQLLQGYMLPGEALGWARRWEERRSVERACAVVSPGKEWARPHEKV